jgi:hypothetical protein
MKKWHPSAVHCPVTVSHGRCALIDETEILIVGGYDYQQDIESTSCYLYNGREFRECAMLPSIGELKFSDPPLVCDGMVYIISDDETLFMLDTRCLNGTSIGTW